MKPYYSLLLAAASCSMAFGAATAYTTPVGYTTETLRPGMYNLTGLTLQKAPVAAGVLTAESATSVSASAFDFGALLTAGKTYILELADGTVQEITAWSGSDLTTPDDISSLVTPDTTTFTLRPAATVTDVFGANNSVGLVSSADGDITTCDTIVVPDPAGMIYIYYFDDGAGTTGWYDGQGNPAEDIVLPYFDGFFVQRVAGTDISLVVTGEVKTDPTGGVLSSGYNYLAGVSPVGLTLATSGLSNYVSQSADGDITTVDTVQLPLADGSYKYCYYFNDGAGFEGWFDGQGSPADDEVITPGFLILNLGGTKPYKLSVPASYSSL